MRNGGDDSGASIRTHCDMHDDAAGQPIHHFHGATYPPAATKPCCLARHTTTNVTTSNTTNAGANAPAP